MKSSELLTDLLTLNSAFSLFLTPPPFPGGLPVPEALAEEINFRVGYVMYPTLWGIGGGGRDQGLLYPFVKLWENN